MDYFGIIIVLLMMILLLIWRFCEKTDSIPGPPGLPVLGNALDLISPTELLSKLMKYVRKYGKILKIQIGPFKKIIVVTDYEIAESLLTGISVRKSDVYRFLRPWLGEGLLTSEGVKWKQQRHILNRSFHNEVLKYYVQVFEDCGDVFVEKLKREVPHRSMNIEHVLELLALDMICETIMGVNIKAQNDSHSDYVRGVQRMCRIIFKRITSPIQMYDFFFFLSRDYVSQKKTLKLLHGVSRYVIDERQKELEITKDGTGRSPKKPFLDTLLTATVDGQNLSPEAIRNEVDTFLFGGHDTTATAFVYVLYCLANHPDVQDKVYKEQTELLGYNKDPSVDFENLQRMKYLDLVIKEALRLYTPVPLIFRTLTEDCEYDSIKFPKGYDIFIFIYGISRDSEHFENPEKFMPSRFENVNGKTSYGFMPFSMGKRNCIGQKFAMLAVKSLVSKMVRNFELQPALPKHELKLHVKGVLHSLTGVHIGLKSRDF